MPAAEGVAARTVAGGAREETKKTNLESSRPEPVPSTRGILRGSDLPLTYALLAQPDNFSKFAGGITLRPYQLPPFNAILRSVLDRAGRSFTIIFSRQSGKDELLAQVIAYLLAVLAHRDATLIMASPTFKPQTENAMSRLEARLEANAITRALKARRRGGYRFQVGRAQAIYFSSEPSANVVGATASHLLIVNEAQDTQPAIYDKRFAPMAAAHNATRVFAGTAWTSDSLLERARRECQAAEKIDHIQRVFIADAPLVAAVSPPYATFFTGEVARLGREHPLIKSQYFCETVDAEAGMFTPAMLAGLQAPKKIPVHLRSSPVAFVIDVAGQSEATNDPETMTSAGRDSTALSIVGIELGQGPIELGPTYHVVERHSWTGDNHLQIFGQIKALAEGRRPQYIVVDASGVGEGLWAMLNRAFGPDVVLPVKFSPSKKTEIGWGFIAILATGRLRDHCHTPAVHTQYARARSEVLPGPSKTLRWGVPEGQRDQAGQLIHDDYLLADALVAQLDQLEWRIPTDPSFAYARDPLADMDTFKP